MLTIVVRGVMNVARTARYYLDGADDFFPTPGEATEWQGKGAAILGLDGAVDRKILLDLLHGEIPPNESNTFNSMRPKSLRHIAIDVAFHAPKSLSLQALVGGDEIALRAHRWAVTRTLSAAEERAQSTGYRDGSIVPEWTRNLVIAKFLHQTSREKDPHLHTHALVMRMTLCGDSRWRALYNSEILKASRYLNRFYHAELAMELERSGYAVRQGQGGLFELAHVTPPRIAAFSRRSAQIEARLSESGLSRATASGKRRRWVTMKTRKGPARVMKDALVTEWRVKAEKARVEFASKGSPREAAGAVAPESKSARSHPEVVAEGARRGVRFAIAHLTEHQAVIGDREILALAKLRSIGEVTLDDIGRELTGRSRPASSSRKPPSTGCRTSNGPMSPAPGPNGPFTSSGAASILPAPFPS